MVRVVGLMSRMRSDDTVYFGPANVFPIGLLSGKIGLGHHIRIDHNELPHSRPGPWLPASQQPRRAPTAMMRVLCIKDRS